MHKEVVRKGIFYDDDDYRLLYYVNEILDKGENPKQIRKLFTPELHPRGIKELAAPRSLRIASAMIDLLGTLRQGQASERVSALRAVHAEALHDSGQDLRFNGARVLLQIMKKIVRSHGDFELQLKLAHNFRAVATGKSRIIRKQLATYHLVEMPEEWNQLAFDHHVHDANTKGRKSPTHLIMDAWIKGIRFLGVIYYNFVSVEAARELLQAAEVMGIQVRIGIEVAARLRNKFAHFIWAPRGFLGPEDFLNFLQEPEIEAFFALGREVVSYERNNILQQLRYFNDEQLVKINKIFGIQVSALAEDDFFRWVGQGQASRVHLAEFIHNSILENLKEKSISLRQIMKNSKGEEREHILALLQDMDAFTPERLVDDFLRKQPNFTDIFSTTEKGHDKNEQPELLRLSPAELLDRLEHLPTRSRITLNPSKLLPSEVLELLYEGRGRITHLEIFNLKDWSQQRTEHREVINDIRLVLNSGNVVEAKRLLREILTETETRNTDPKSDELVKLREILWDMNGLLSFYSNSRLRSRLGSDSIGQSRFTHGMGLVVVSTLAWRPRQRIQKETGRMLPVSTLPLRHVTTALPPKNQDSPLLSRWRHDTQRSHHETVTRRVSWSVGQNSTQLSKQSNIGTLGGSPEQSNNGLLQNDDPQKNQGPRKLGQMNSAALNIAKVLIGFLPAFATFYLTKDWWLLAYFGAVIWFGITGLRNILQSVVGGGGLRQSSLLNWNDYVSWSRVADSLLFTGFSVPLLDFVVKDQILSHGFNITTSTNTLALYSFMALANGIYISSHNTFRGLPTAAAVGNFFRSILSIPVALFFNFVLFELLIKFGAAEHSAELGLQIWAAVISKTASDFVAAIIEGSADRQRNLRQRRYDYQEKLAQVYELYGQLESRFPEKEVLELLEKPRELVQNLREAAPDLLRSIIINALDLLYFWMYQPRARSALKLQLAQMSKDEMRFFVLLQQVLLQKRAISELLLGGLVGKRFDRALAFYLSQSERYLKLLKKMTGNHLNNEAKGT